MVARMILCPLRFSQQVGRSIRFFSQLSISRQAGVLTDSPSKPVEPQEGEISLQMIAAPVTEGDLDANISDTATVGGTFGVAKVVATGSKVTSLSTGNLVLLSHYKQGSWQRQLLASPKDVVAVPLGLLIENAATLIPGPVVALKALQTLPALEGETLLVSGHCPIAQSIVQLAHQKKAKVISIIPSLPGEDEMREVMKQLGALACVSEEYAGTKSFQRLLQDLPRPKAFAHDHSLGELLRATSPLLGDGMKVVPFGSHKINNPQAVTPASIDRENMHQLINSAATLITEGRLKLLLERTDPAHFKDVIASVSHRNSYRRPIFVF